MTLERLTTYAILAVIPFLIIAGHEGATTDPHQNRADQYQQEHREARQMNKATICTRHVAAIAHTVDFWSASTADRAFKACVEEW